MLENPHEIRAILQTYEEYENEFSEPKFLWCVHQHKDPEDSLDGQDVTDDVDVRSVF